MSRRRDALPADVACSQHPTVRAEACEICNCRDCGDLIDPAARALGSDVCSSCWDKADAGQGSGQ